MTFKRARAMGEFWDWKYLRYPGFNRSFVAVAEGGGEIVGCNHWLPRQVKLSNSVSVDSMLGAHIAVVPEYRRKGVGRALIHFLRKQHSDRKPSLMYMFANPELSKHFHTPVGGYIPAPSDTVLYMRILNWNKVKKRADAFNERVKHGEFRNQLVRVDLNVTFKVHGAPPLYLHLDKTGVEIDAPTENADVTISCDLATLSKIKGKRSGLGELILLLLAGRLKLRGSIAKMLTMYRHKWVFKRILREMIT